MVLARPQVILAAAGKPMPRNAIGAAGLQIYGRGGMFWSKKAVIIRNAPYTIESPHIGQIETRIQFGEIAKAAKGQRGFRDGLPVAAYTVREGMRGFRAPSRMPEEAYPSKTRSSFHTLEDLKTMLEQKRRAAAAPATY